MVGLAGELRTGPRRLAADLLHGRRRSSSRARAHCAGPPSLMPLNGFSWLARVRIAELSAAGPHGLVKQHLALEMELEWS